MVIENTIDLIIQDVNGDVDKGGWYATASFANNQEDAVYGRHAELFVLVEGGGSWAESSKLALSGSITPQTMRFTRRQSNTSVVIATTDAFLSNAGLQGIYFSEQPAPANPHQMTDLNLGKIVQHIIRDHTNIADSTPGGWVDISGIDILHSTSVDVYTVRQSNSIWSAIADIASNEFYVRYFNLKDEFIYDQHPQFKASLPDPTVTLDTTMMIEAPELIYRNEARIDQVLLYALTDDGDILTSFYPANTGTEGRRHKIANLRCNSQARLNQLSERAYKFLNRQYNFRVSVPGAWGIYLELYDRVAVTYAGTTRNGVTLDWTDKKFWIASISIRRSGNYGATTELLLDEENT